MHDAFQRALSALFLVLAIGGSASAQDDVTISGSVTTRSDGLAVGDAVVSIAGTSDTTTTDASGRFRLPGAGTRKLPSSSESLTPSFNFPRPTITDGTDTVRPATLRGLGPDQVLVLVNGKRRHQSALVHLNSSIGRGSTSVDLNAHRSSSITLSSAGSSAVNPATACASVETGSADMPGSISTSNDSARSAAWSRSIPPTINCTAPNG